MGLCSRGCPGGHRSSMSVHELPSRPPATLPPDRYVSRQELAAMWGVCLRTIDRMRKEPGFPTPVPFGRRVCRFRLGDVQAWLDQERAA